MLGGSYSSSIITQDNFMMHRSALFGVVCSAVLGISYAAGMGSKEDYASGAVHAQIMGLKMVMAYEESGFAV